MLVTIHAYEHPGLIILRRKDNGLIHEVIPETLEVSKAREAGRRCGVATRRLFGLPPVSKT